MTKHKKVFDYHGFESTYDLERDMSELFDNREFADVPGEFQGLLRVTVEYIPPEEDLDAVVEQMSDRLYNFDEFLGVVLQDLDKQELEKVSELVRDLLLLSDEDREKVYQILGGDDE